MRKTVAALVLGAGLAVAALPAAPASAYCIYLTEDPYAQCVDPPCLADLYAKADARTGGALPDRDGWACLE